MATRDCQSVQSVKAKFTDQMLQLAEIVRPKLVKEGMFMVGLAILQSPAPRAMDDYLDSNIVVLIVLINQPTARQPLFDLYRKKYE